MSCYGCVCNFCLYNCELEAQYIAAGEIKDISEICYCCDECEWYDGDFRKPIRWRKECSRFREPIKRTEAKRLTAERIAQRKRALFRVIEGGKDAETE